MKDKHTEQTNPNDTSEEQRSKTQLGAAKKHENNQLICPDLIIFFFYEKNFQIGLAAGRMSYPLAVMEIEQSRKIRMR